MIPRIQKFLLSGFLILLCVIPHSLFAESFPSPGSAEGRSLLGVPIRIEGDAKNLKGTSVVLDGPRALKVEVGKDEWDIRWFRVSPGAYSVDPSTPSVDMGTVGRNGRFDVPADAIMVAPFRIVFFEEEGHSVARLELVNEEDRQRAALRLGLYFDFPGWYGREYVGFGSLRPSVEQDQTLYTATLVSSPDGAEVYLDDRLVGTTPLELNLSDVKHKLFFRRDGHDDVTRYVRLERDARVDVELPPTEVDENIDGEETYRTIVGTFYPMGSADTQLANLFADTLEIALDEDERLTVIREELVWNDNSGIVFPDFAVAEESEADLIVTGFFRKDGNELIVQANLYDIQAESTKAGFTWSGEVGLSIFDAMDEISASFMESVDRYLPAAGRTLETRTEILYEATSEEEYDIFRNSLIRNRWQEHRHALTFQGGFGGTMQDLRFVAPDLSDRNGIDSPGLVLNLDWTYDLGPYFAFTTGLTLTPYIEGESNDNSVIDFTSPFAYLGFYFGPKVMFRNLKSDLYFGLNASFKWTPEYSVSWDEGTPYTVTGGSFIYLGLPIQAGIRYYFAERADSTPWYLDAGMSLSFLGYRFDVSGRTEDGFVSFDAFLYLGIGVRL